MDTDRWISEKVEQIFLHDMVQDPVIPRMTALVELTNLASSHCLPMGVVSNLFNTLGIGYFRIVSFSVEKKVRDHWAASAPQNWPCVPTWQWKGTNKTKLKRYEVNGVITIRWCFTKHCFWQGVHNFNCIIRTCLFLVWSWVYEKRNVMSTIGWN